MSVDTTELRKLLAEATNRDPAIAESQRSDALRRLVNNLPELLDELDRMRPYAVRCGWFEDMETAAEWLSDC